MRKSGLILLLGVFTVSAETLEFELTDDGLLSFNSQLNRVVLSDDVDLTDTCSSAVYPPNLSINEGVYSDYNDGMRFGESTNTTVLANISIFEFLSLSDFGTDKINFRRRVVFATAPTNFNAMYQATISVSHCPGDFSDSAVCNKVVNNGSTVLFSTKPSDNPDVFCVLNPTRDYYFNIVLSENPYTEPPSCANVSALSCAAFFTEVLLN